MATLFLHKPHKFIVTPPASIQPLDSRSPSQPFFVHHPAQQHAMPPKSPDHPESDKSYKHNPEHKPGEFVENDLWNLDDSWDMDTPDSEKNSPVPERTTPKPIPPGPRAKPAIPSAAAAGIPAARQPKPTETPDAPRSPEPRAQKHPEPSVKPVEPAKPSAKPERIPVPMEAQKKAPPPEAALAKATTDEAASAPPAPLADASKSASDTKKPSGDTNAASGDEAPAETRRPPLKAMERISLIGVAVFLIAVLGFGVKVFFNQIPTGKQGLEAPDFPVKGQLVTVKDASTFWRKPLRGGPNGDTARSDVMFIPVIDLSAEIGGEGALRVFFRNGDGRLVGDSVTRAFSGGHFATTGEPKIQIAATSGFKDLASYAAYDTGESVQWTIEVYEGSDPQAPLKSFRLLFKTPIEADRR
jgi:hypothetical protein